MLEDRYGNPISTGYTAARDAYVEALDRFLAGGAGIEQAYVRAIAADPQFALARIGLARFFQVMGRAGEAQAELAAARNLAGTLTAREEGHLATLALLIDGRAQTAYHRVRAHLADFPRDVLIAQTSVSVFGLIGLSGQPGREAEQLAFTTSLAPHYGDDWWFLAQHAFAQVEAGQRGPAEATAERALQLNPRNVYAAHVRAHVYYENGDAEGGFAYLCDWLEDYESTAILNCHMSWHRALWALETGDTADMWRVIDRSLDPARSFGPPLNRLTDMAAILYRAELAGLDVPRERWQPVSDYALAAFPRPGLAFADIHAALAHAMVGRSEALDKIVRDAAGPAADMVRDLSEAFAAMVRESWPEAIAHFARAVPDHARIGGSHAQRDLIEFAMLACLLRAGRAGEARFMLVTRRPLISTAHAVAGLWGQQRPLREELAAPRTGSLSVPDLDFADRRPDPPQPV